MSLIMTTRRIARAKLRKTLRIPSEIVVSFSLTKPQMRGVHALDIYIDMPTIFCVMCSLITSRHQLIDESHCDFIF